MLSIKMSAVAAFGYSIPRLLRCCCLHSSCLSLMLMPRDEPPCRELMLQLAGRSASTGGSLLNVASRSRSSKLPTGSDRNSAAHCGAPSQKSNKRTSNVRTSSALQVLFTWATRWHSRVVASDLDLVIFSAIVVAGATVECCGRAEYALIATLVSNVSTTLQKTSW